MPVNSHDNDFGCADDGYAGASGPGFPVAMQATGMGNANTKDSDPATDQNEMRSRRVRVTMPAASRVALLAMFL